MSPMLAAPAEHQRSSHAGLMHDASDEWLPRDGPPTRGVEGIVVPASRGVHALDPAANLSIRLGVPLLVMCSLGTRADRAADHLARKPGCRALLIDVPRDYRHALVPTRTSAEPFREASAGRRSDLSLKRNLGLLIARLQGWGKVLFLDDDIYDPTAATPLSLPIDMVHRLAHQLDSHQVAGLDCRDFPDNSVVCHARRLAGLPQDTFVTGAALGVNCNDQPLPFFPDVYNEDWFFFSRLAARREVAYVGRATQLAFDPFADTRRARSEEFGDLLAEGLYALFQEQRAEMDYFDRLAAADAPYWSNFITARRSILWNVRQRLMHGSRRWGRDAGRRYDAVRALTAADAQLSTLSPDLCVDFLAAWAADLTQWERAAQSLRGSGDTARDLRSLRLDQWTAVGPTANWAPASTRGPSCPFATPGPAFRRH